PAYREAALKAARFAVTALRSRDGAPVVSWRDGRPGGRGCLGDSAYLAQGFLDLYDASKDRTWVSEARSLVRDASRFFDAEQGGYFLAPAGSADLIVRTKSLADDALPSANAVMVGCLARLAALERDRSFLDPALLTLSLAGPGMADS